MKKQLEGKISVNLSETDSLDELCETKIASYDRRRFEIVVVRVFAGEEFIVTVYAADKFTEKNVKVDKYPVKNSSSNTSLCLICIVL